MSNTNQLWWLLSTEDMAKLMMYQWDNYGLELEMANQQPPARDPIIITQTEDTEEVDKIMRQPPSRSRNNEKE